MMDAIGSIHIHCTRACLECVRACVPVCMQQRGEALRLPEGELGLFFFGARSLNEGAFPVIIRLAMISSWKDGPGRWGKREH